MRTSNRWLGPALIVAGILIVVVSLLADVIGIGAHPRVIGWRQIAAAIVGLAILVAGIVSVRRAA